MPKAASTTDDKTGSRTYRYPADQRDLWSVTTITGGTQDKSHILIPWNSRLISNAALDNLDMLKAMLAEENGRQLAMDWLKDTGERNREIKSRAGVFVHDVVEALFNWALMPEGRGDAIPYPDIPEDLAEAFYDGDPVPEVVAAMIDGFTRFVSEWNPILVHSEMTGYNVQLGVAGTIDLILIIPDAAIVRRGKKKLALVRKKGSRVVLLIDAKTGKYLTATMEEQLGGYEHMTECDPTGLGDLRKMPPVDAVAVLHLRREFKRGYRLKIIDPRAATAGWNRFRKAAQIWVEREDIKAVGCTVYPPTEVEGGFPDVDIADQERYGRAPSALVKADFVTLADVTTVTADELEVFKGIGPKTVPIIREMLNDYDMYLAGETPGTVTPEAEEAA